ncbi:hypothetical protein [Candidatus Enterovibrio escicola]|uniref:Uncharacterized protein n=1 Tax=Candidatus Enterovibrio escicola TaxID=1927127 RepID=A0A2A5T2K0_9GAMM|nr:hypothetical protein [Candidatus Enterovibrio escacola]PCS22395.1 hypothetical protein BTN49_2124 [Candidatus Enterovibrio escacola]
MKPEVMKLWNRLNVEKTIYDRDNICLIKQHIQNRASSARNAGRFMVNLTTGFITYTFQPEKLNRKITRLEKATLYRS